MHWFGVRSIYRSSDFDDRGYAYEERIVIFEAQDFDDAIAQAQTEAAEYAGTVGVEALELFQAYCLPEKPASGEETFSLVRRSALDAEAYVDHFIDTGEEIQGSAN